MATSLFFPSFNCFYSFRSFFYIQCSSVNLYLLKSILLNLFGYVLSGWTLFFWLRHLSLFLYIVSHNTFEVSTAFILYFLFVIFPLLFVFSSFMLFPLVGRFLNMNSNSLIEGGIPFSFFLLDSVLISWVVQGICLFHISYWINWHTFYHFSLMSMGSLAIFIISLLIFLISLFF